MLFYAGTITQGLVRSHDWISRLDFTITSHTVRHSQRGLGPVPKIIPVDCSFFFLGVRCDQSFYLSNVKKSEDSKIRNEAWREFSVEYLSQKRNINETILLTSSVGFRWREQHLSMMLPLTSYFCRSTTILLSTITLIMADLPALRNSVVKSFTINPFVPRAGPFGIFTNKHWQTIIGSEALQRKFLGPYPR